MAEKVKVDINIPIEERIKAAKGAKIGDNLVNPLERKLYDDIVTEHGSVMADTHETMNQDFLNLIEDVWDVSEGNQARLGKVAEMLGVTLEKRDDALQMSYKLFQEILKFQKEHDMKLTGIIDDTLYQALKKHTEAPKLAKIEKKPEANTPEKTPPRDLPAKWSVDAPTSSVPPSTYPTKPDPLEKTTPVEIPVAIGKKYEGDEWRISAPPVPNTTIKTSAAQNTPVQPTSNTAEKPTIQAVPIEEATIKEEEVKKVISEEGKKLWITINGLEISESPLGKEIVDMIIYYEWPGGRRKKDVGNTFEIWGGINTGSSVEEKKYALGDNYSEWNADFIPKENVRECVLRLLNVRIALTKKSCADKWVDFDALPQNVKGVLVDLHYNMPNNINQFTKFWTAIKEQNWQEAGKQLVDNGNGSPSGYLSQVAGRAYANALMLANGDTNYREYKQEAEKISGGANLLNQYNQKVGEYGRKVGMWERKEIVTNAQNAGDIISQTTSDDVLKTKWSTQSVIKILDKYIAEHPGERNALIAGLSEKVGNFSRPLQNSAEIWAFQQLVYLTNPEAFKELVYIDGEYGGKTEAAFVREAFSLWGWQEKIEWVNGLLSKNPADISTYIVWLNNFEKGLLQRHYAGTICDANSNSTDIKKAQLWLALSGVNLAVDGVWNDQMRELLEYPELAKSLGNFVENNYWSYGGGAFSCGASVGRMLNGFGIQGLPQSDRHGKNWDEFLDARLDQFTKVEINSPDDARPGGILCYNGGGGGSRSYMAKQFGHVEVKGSNGKYYYYNESDHWGGSAGANLKNSEFCGHVYYPRRKEA